MTSSSSIPFLYPKRKKRYKTCLKIGKLLKSKLERCIYFFIPQGDYNFYFTFLFGVDVYVAVCISTYEIEKVVGRVSFGGKSGLN